ncbi:MAG: glycosyltransferase family 4 protein [Vicinamibacteria bacterium]|nr:glycosyltransferase family 4 protein [Vicinamibacteria bacterium]
MALVARGAYPLHPPGGMEKAVYLLARHLAARGVETVLYTRPAHDGTPGVAFPGEVVPIAYGALPGLRHGRVLDRTLLYPGFARRAGAAVAAAVRAGRVDVVDAQGLCALGYGRLRERDAALRAPLVMNPQGLEEHRTRGFKRLALSRLRRLSREAARLADRVVATDASARDEVVRLLGVPSARVVTLPNGIDPDEIRARTPTDPAAFVAARWPALATARPLLLSVGRLEVYKGFADTLAALRLLRSRGALPAAAAWAVAGDGPLLAALRQAAPELPVVALGRVDDEALHALFACADLFVHVPHFEGSSLVTLEAMAHGRPLLASRAGGLVDKVVDGETGRLVPAADPAALADALEDVLADPERARAWGARGRERALLEFAWPALAARVEALYRELLAERAGGVGFVAEER